MTEASLAYIDTQQHAYCILSRVDNAACPTLATERYLLCTTGPCPSQHHLLNHKPVIIVLLVRATSVVSTVTPQHSCKSYG